jgi:hypothetical protein
MKKLISILLICAVFSTSLFAQAAPVLSQVIETKTTQAANTIDDLFADVEASVLTEEVVEQVQGGSLIVAMIIGGAILVAVVAVAVKANVEVNPLGPRP